jgi:hypothetical protein
LFTTPEEASMSAIFQVEVRFIRKNPIFRLTVDTAGRTPNETFEARVSLIHTGGGKAIPLVVRLRMKASDSTPS